jgi:hypothetical protein
MILHAYVIRDSKAQIYNTPFFKHTHGEAERDFTSLVNDSNTNNNVNKYPEDFDLYHVGRYDDQTGKFEALPTPEHIVKAVSVQRVQN